MPTGVYPRILSGWSKGLTKETDGRIARMALAKNRSIPIDECARLYYEEKMALREIGNRLGLCPTTIWKKLREAGFSLRSRKEALNLDKTRQRQSELRKGRALSPEHRERLSQACKGRLPWNKGLTIDDPRIKAMTEKVMEARREKPNWNKGKTLSELHRQRLSESHKGKTPWSKGLTISDPRIAAFVEAGAKANRGRVLSFERRRKIASTLILASRRRPTTPEQRVIEICQKHFPQFKYNGDYSLGITIGTFVPDFVNINGKKQVIEVFGDYWHSPQVRSDWKSSELGRIMAYNSLGFSCLVLWERDINSESEEELVSKIKAFTKRR